MEDFESVSLDHHGHGHSHGEPEVVQAFSNPDFQAHTHSFRSVLQQPDSQGVSAFPQTLAAPPFQPQSFPVPPSPSFAQPTQFYAPPPPSFSSSSASSSSSSSAPFGESYRRHQPAPSHGGSPAHDFGFSSRPARKNGLCCPRREEGVMSSHSTCSPKKKKKKKKKYNVLDTIKSIWMQKDKRGFWIYEVVRLIFSLLAVIFSVSFESTGLPLSLLSFFQINE